MNNLLNKVEIKNTFRINAASALEAAKASVPAHLEVQSADLVLGSDLVFLVVSTLGNSTFHDVMFVETTPNGYRVESGAVRLSDIEFAFVTGGDDAVNELGAYVESRTGKAVTSDEYEKTLAYWIANDAEENTPNRMESHIKDGHKKSIIINGKFEEVK